MEELERAETAQEAVEAITAATTAAVAAAAAAEGSTRAGASSDTGGPSASRGGVKRGSAAPDAASLGRQLRRVSWSDETPGGSLEAEPARSAESASPTGPGQTSAPHSSVAESAQSPGGGAATGGASTKGGTASAATALKGGGKGGSKGLRRGFFGPPPPLPPPAVGLHHGGQEDEGLLFNSHGLVAGSPSNVTAEPAFTGELVRSVSVIYILELAVHNGLVLRFVENAELCAVVQDTAVMDASI